MSWHGNTFRFTATLSWESTSDRDSPHKWLVKNNFDALMVLLWANSWSNSWDACEFRCHVTNVTLMLTYDWNWGVFSQTMWSQWKISLKYIRSLTITNIYPSLTNKDFALNLLKCIKFNWKGFSFNNKYLKWNWRLFCEMQLRGSFLKCLKLIQGVFFKWLRSNEDGFLNSLHETERCVIKCNGLNHTKGSFINGSNQTKGCFLNGLNQTKGHFSNGSNQTEWDFLKLSVAWSRSIKFRTQEILDCSPGTGQYMETVGCARLIELQ